MSSINKATREEPVPETASKTTNEQEKKSNAIIIVGNIIAFVSLYRFRSKEKIDITLSEKNIRMIQKRTINEKFIKQIFWIITLTHSGFSIPMTFETIEFAVAPKAQVGIPQKI